MLLKRCLVIALLVAASSVNSQNTCQECCAAVTQSNILKDDFKEDRCIEDGCNIPNFNCTSYSGQGRWKKQRSCYVGQSYRSGMYAEWIFENVNSSRINLYCIQESTNQVFVSSSQAPTKAPTGSPTKFPTPFPTFFPTVSPSSSPTTSPTRFPTTSAPTKSPTTSAPTKAPTSSPTKSPTTSVPTRSPTTSAPTRSPTTSAPTRAPTTSAPTSSPTTSAPTKSPTTEPTSSPTVPTTASPTEAANAAGKSSSSPNKAIGGGISAVAIILVGLLGALWVFRNRRRRENKPLVPSGSGSSRSDSRPRYQLTSFDGRGGDDAMTDMHSSSSSHPRESTNTSYSMPAVGVRPGFPMPGPNYSTGSRLANSPPSMHGPLRRSDQIPGPPPRTMPNSFDSNVPVPPPRPAVGGWRQYRSPPPPPPLFDDGTSKLPLPPPPPFPGLKKTGSFLSEDREEDLPPF